MPNKISDCVFIFMLQGASDLFFDMMQKIVINIISSYFSRLIQNAHIKLQREKVLACFGQMAYQAVFAAKKITLQDCHVILIKEL